MVNNRAKCSRSNSKARAWLLKNGYSNLHFFPHLRFLKDWVIDEGCGFDGICSKFDHLALFQIKSNRNISSEERRKFGEISMKYNCECLWFNFRDRKDPQIFSTEVQQ